jgi:thioredoxin 1
VLKPKVKELTEQYPGVEFSYINIRELPQISGQYLVFAVPTIILFSDGKEQRRYSRHFSIDDLQFDLEKLHSLIFD